MIGETFFTAPGKIFCADFNDRYGIVVYAANDEHGIQIRKDVNLGAALQAINNLAQKESNQLDKIFVEPAEIDFEAKEVYYIDIVNTTDGSFINRIPFVSSIREICISNSDQLFVTIQIVRNDVILSYDID